MIFENFTIRSEMTLLIIKKCSFETTILPEDKYLLQSKNPPKIEIEFYEDIDNLDQINCFSNEGNKWRNSKLTFASKNILKIEIVEKFVGERGRVNCSLKEKDGYWRWLGMQYVVSEK